jgi:hypothetical protein
MILRERGMVTAKRDGQSVIYQLADERVIQALDLLRGVLADKLKNQAVLANSVIESLEAEISNRNDLEDKLKHSILRRRRGTMVEQMAEISIQMNGGSSSSIVMKLLSAWLLFIPFGIYSPSDVVKPKRNFTSTGTVIFSDIDVIEPDENRVRLQKIIRYPL